MLDGRQRALAFQGQHQANPPVLKPAACGTEFLEGELAGCMQSHGEPAEPGESVRHTVMAGQAASGERLGAWGLQS